MTEREGISVKEATKKRERMFSAQHRFREMKMAEYFKLKKKKEFGTLEEANLVLERIMAAWNNLTTENRKSFDERNDGELRQIYRMIKVDFSGL